MGRVGKAYAEALKEVDRERLYEPREALELVKRTARANFDETIEAAFRLGVNPKHADQMVRGSVVLPSGTGKDPRVIAFAKGEKAKEAEEAGADFVGAEDLAERVEGGWLDFDMAVATPDMMKVVGKLGRILGPRGLMPNPKAGTVTFELKQVIEEIKKGKIEFRTDRTGIVHVPIGKASFSADELRENFRAVVDVIMRLRPASAKGQYVRSVVLSSTMGPGVRVNPHSLSVE